MKKRMKSNKEPAIAILTVNFNSEDRTLKLLNSLKDSSHKDFVVYIVDNASQPQKLEVLKKQLPKYKFKINLIESKRNLGWGIGCNLAFKEIIKKKIKYTFVVNNDSEIDKHTLGECLSFMKKDEKIGICGVRIYDKEGKLQTTGGKMTWMTKLAGVTSENKERAKIKKETILKNSEFVDDCAWMIKSNILEEIGFYPEYLFLYFEEIYIVIGARRKGYLIAYNPKATVRHEGYGSSGVVKNPIPVFYLARNRIIFMKDFFPIYFPLFIVNYLAIIVPFMAIKNIIKKRRNLNFFMFRGVMSGLTYLFKKKKLFLLKENNEYVIKEIA